MIKGPRSNDTIKKIIDTFVIHDNFHRDEIISKNFPHYFQPQMASLTLSIKYFERAKLILKENKKLKDLNPLE